MFNSNVKIKSILSFVLFLSAIPLIALTDPSFEVESAEGEEMHVCPGSGEACVGELQWKGETIKVNSYKTKGSGTVVVK